MKKVFFFDVDGTLLPHGNEKGVDVKTIYALNALKANGHDVVIATGKSEQMAKAQIDAIGANSHITMNGAHIVVDNKVMHVDRFDQETLDQLTAIAAENNLMLGCQTRDEYYIIDVNYDQELAKSVLKNVSLDLPPVYPQFKPDSVIGQLWFIGEVDKLDFDCEIVPGHRLLRWHNQGCDIVINNVSKASAIAKYKEHVYPNQEVFTYAFGDGNNDIEMLTDVNVGVAMDNGVNALKAVADEITDSCEDLGVYNYLVKNNYIEEM